MIIDKTKIQETVDYIQSQTKIRPEVGIILGSGLGAVVDLLEESVHIPYSDIPNFPVSTVKGHGGQLAFGTYAGKGIVVQEGRVHFYEGLGADKVMYPLFVMKALGVKTIINTNAAGGINPDFAGGDLMLIEDHISEPIDKILKMMSCRSAIKFGDPLSNEGMEALIDDLEKLGNQYTCVHGRPCVIEFTFIELEKMFKRRV